MRNVLLSIIAFLALLSFNACSDTELYQEPPITQEELTVKKGAEQEKGIEADALYQSEANEQLTMLINSFGTTKNRF